MFSKRGVPCAARSPETGGRSDLNITKERPHSSAACFLKPPGLWALARPQSRALPTATLHRPLGSCLLRLIPEAVAAPVNSGLTYSTALQSRGLSHLRLAQGTQQHTSRVSDELLVGGPLTNGGQVAMERQQRNAPSTFLSCIGYCSHLTGLREQSLPWKKWQPA